MRHILADAHPTEGRDRSFIVLHLKLVDGSDIYINALAVRFIMANGVQGQCDLHFDASDRVTLAGDAKHVAETVHKGLRIIHHSQE